MKHNVDIEEIKRLYAQGLGVREVGSKVGVPARTVSRYLQNAGAKLRNPGVEHIPALSDAAWLSQKYVSEGLSTTDIASILGTGASRVSHWLRKLGIPTRGTGAEPGHNRTTDDARRKMSEAKRGKLLGPKAWNWKDGVHDRDRDRNRYPALAWSKAIKSRDKVCQECGADEQLHAHHIKRWKDYPSLRYDLNNGITLCQPCHERAHGRGFKFKWNTTPKCHERITPDGEDIV